MKWKRTGKSGILLDLKTGDYFELNEIALAIWRMLDGKSSLAKVAGKLAQSYAAPEKIVEKDVIHFVSELRKRKLVDVGKS
ncbi:MAG: pyrroloquinoline quinone biosynthesis peptide chaperone PqqD [Acidobacteria bacterium]|nr:pyrroloquinoline quinone biosynthesis peptide chaperone PqqD [Acidobacteriota bacterium]